LKKLINRPQDVVEEMIQGLVAINPGLRRLPSHTVIVRADADEARDRQVALISGGGSGHEPAHAGYVGSGMLSAAVAGDVFTSPSPDAVLAAIRAVTGPKGAVLIVKNYTGDRLNFGLAAEVARSEGIPIEIVIVAEDVALAESTEIAGRRGIAGTVFVHKVAGAAAAAGLDLQAVAAEARAAADAVRTMGVALSACTVPAAGKPGFELGPREIELGLGIHGEPGVRRGPLEGADALVAHLLERILADRSLADARRVALLVNNLGGTTMMELAIVARRAVQLLEDRKDLLLERVYAGTFMSALEMAGISLSVLKLDDSRLARLDALTSASAWPRPAERGRRSREAPVQKGPEPPRVSRAAVAPTTDVGRRLDLGIRAVADSLIAEAARLTSLDQAVGDGDLGISLARGAQAVLDALPSTPLDDPATALTSLGQTLQRVLGGTSGPLYGLFLLRAANDLRSKNPTEATSWAEAFREGCRAIGELGGAAPGDRTMLDALTPAGDAFTSALAAGRTSAEAISAAAGAAEAGARATAAMMPRRGRSTYLGDRALGHVDPGAEAVAVWLRALANTW
jgi:dihydroxyacetone kinase